MVENEIVLKSSCLERTGLAQKLAWKIGKIKHEPSEDNKDNREDILSGYNLLMEEPIKGIGPVYAVTLLFFISNGAIPIYDRFAEVAINSLFDGKYPCQGDSSKLAPFFIERYIEDYKPRIDCLYRKVFPKDKKINYLTDNGRMLDRALWVYGHGYKKSCL